MSSGSASSGIGSRLVGADDIELADAAGAELTGLGVAHLECKAHLQLS